MTAAPYVTPATRNVTRIFRDASDADIRAGAQWYSDALRIAGDLAAAHDVELDIVCGIIAALSPLNSWGNNVNLAARFLAAGGLETGYLSAGLAKARAILAGAPIEPTLNGHKVINFYRSIRSAGVDGVCIDRHAYAVAANTRFGDDEMPSLTPKRYAETVDCYVRAARILTRERGQLITPAQVQSVTWALWRRRYWAAGAFDRHSLEMAS